MTLFRATVLDTPDDPFTGGTLRAEDDVGLLVSDGVIVERGAFADGARPATRTRTSSTSPSGCCCPGSSTPTCTSRRSGRSAGSGCRCWTGSSSAPCPRRRGWPTPTTRAAVADDFVGGLLQAGHDDGAGLRRPLRPGRRRPVRAGRRGAGLRITSGLVVSDRLLRDDLLTTPQRAYDEGLALARRWHGRGAQPLRRHPALLALVQRRAARRRAGRCCGDVPGALVHLAHQREPRTRSRPSSGCSARTLPRQLRQARPRRAAAACSRTTCTRPRRSSTCSPARGQRSRTARPATPRWAAGCSRCAARRRRRARRARLRRRRRHRLLAVQGGPAGLLHPAAARRRGLPAHPGAPAPPGHRGRGRGPRPGRQSATCRRQAVRRGLAAPPAWDVAGGLAAARRGPDQALATVFALATDADVAAVWIDGEAVHTRATSEEDAPADTPRPRRRLLWRAREAGTLQVGTGGDARDRSS